MSEPRYPRSYYPIAGVVVYDGETVDEAFRRAWLNRARNRWIDAARELAALHAATPWWEDFMPEGRS